MYRHGRSMDGVGHCTHLFSSAASLALYAQLIIVQMEEYAVSGKRLRWVSQFDANLLQVDVSPFPWAVGFMLVTIAAHR